MYYIYTEIYIHTQVCVKLTHLGSCRPFQQLLHPRRKSFLPTLPLRINKHIFVVVVFVVSRLSWVSNRQNLIPSESSCRRRRAAGPIFFRSLPRRRLPRTPASVEEASEALEVESVVEEGLRHVLPLHETEKKHVVAAEFSTLLDAPSSPATTVRHHHVSRRRLRLFSWEIS